MTSARISAKTQRKALLTGVLFVVFLFLAGCGKNQKVTTVTLWHVYGGQTDSPLNTYIDEFNRTIGREEGVFVETTLVSNTNTIHDKVLASAYHDAGAEEFPDMFSSYPKTVLALPDEQVLVDFHDYFTEQELDGFVPGFLEEGTINGRLTILPVAKSTEILYINQTGYDRFAEETGVKMEDLQTWEGLFDQAVRYAKWTDEKTPEIPDDPKNFFVHDYHFNYFQVGVESLGEDFFEENRLAFGPAFAKVWKPYADAALAGGMWLEEGYATQPLRTGDSIVSVASSASVLYYQDIVTYPDNTSEPITILARPCPVFQDGKKMAMQRGAGICVTKSTPEREKACMLFLRWLTDEERNTEFVTSLGYMPVKERSFTEFLPEKVKTLTDPKYISLYEAYISMQKDYLFYTAPQMQNYLDLEMRFEKLVRQILTVGRREAADGTEVTDHSLLHTFRTEYEKVQK